MRIVFWLALTIALSGCANWPEHQASQQARYVGKPVDSLYTEYGVPIGIAPTSDGGRFLEFRHNRGGYECTAKVRIDSQSIVTEIKVGGQNGCITPI